MDWQHVILWLAAIAGFTTIICVTIRSGVQVEPRDPLNETLRTLRETQPDPPMFRSYKVSIPVAGGYTPEEMAVMAKHLNLAHVADMTPEEFADYFEKVTTELKDARAEAKEQTPKSGTPQNPGHGSAPSAKDSHTQAYN